MVSHHVQRRFSTMPFQTRSSGLKRLKRDYETKDRKDSLNWRLAFFLARVLKETGIMAAGCLFILFTSHMLLLTEESHGLNPDYQSFRVTKLRIGIFMTTHQSDEHMAFLSKCWVSDSHRLELARSSDLFFYSSAPEIPYELLNHTGFRNVIVHRYEERDTSKNLTKGKEKQKGAKMAIVDPYVNHWFDGYDWLVSCCCFRHLVFYRSLDSCFCG
jgi:hypothetical protein